MKTALWFSVLLAALQVGCTGQQRPQPSVPVASQLISTDAQATAVDGVSAPCSAVVTDAGDARNTTNSPSCFGIPCSFSGKLSDKQEKAVPSELRGAFYVESVRDITPAELAEQLKHKRKVAEETSDGVTYAAVQDYRCATFPSGVSGMMIVIERYRLTDASPTPRPDTHSPGADKSGVSNACPGAANDVLKDCGITNVLDATVFAWQGTGAKVSRVAVTGRRGAKHALLIAVRDPDAAAPQLKRWYVPRISVMLADGDGKKMWDEWVFGNRDYERPPGRDELLALCRELWWAGADLEWHYSEKR